MEAAIGCWNIWPLWLSSIAFLQIVQDESLFVFWVCLSLVLSVASCVIATDEYRHMLQHDVRIWCTLLSTVTLDMCTYLKKWKSSPGNFQLHLNQQSSKPGISLCAYGCLLYWGDVWVHFHNNTSRIDWISTSPMTSSAPIHPAPQCNMVTVQWLYKCTVWEMRQWNVMVYIFIFIAQLVPQEVDNAGRGHVNERTYRISCDIMLWYFGTTRQ